MASYIDQCQGWYNVAVVNAVYWIYGKGGWESGGVLKWKVYLNRFAYNFSETGVRGLSTICSERDLFYWSVLKASLWLWDENRNTNAGTVLYVRFLMCIYWQCVIDGYHISFAFLFVWCRYQDMCL